LEGFLKYIEAGVGNLTKIIVIIGQIHNLFPHCLNDRAFHLIVA